MPNGATGPGKVFSAPPPVPKSGPPGSVPENGLTFCARSALALAFALALAGASGAGPGAGPPAAAAGSAATTAVASAVTSAVVKTSTICGRRVRRRGGADIGRSPLVSRLTTGLTTLSQSVQEYAGIDGYGQRAFPQFAVTWP